MTPIILTLLSDLDIRIKRNNLYCKTLSYFTYLILQILDYKKEVKSLIENLNITNDDALESNKIKIPVCCDENFSLDIKRLEEKLQITKLAWETKGTRSVRNDIKIKEAFNFKQSAKDLLITSQLRTALILNKEIKATNYQIDTYKKIIYIYGIALTSDEKDEVIKELSKSPKYNFFID